MIKSLPSNHFFPAFFSFLASFWTGQIQLYIRRAQRQGNSLISSRQRIWMTFTIKSGNRNVLITNYRIKCISAYSSYSFSLKPAAWSVSRRTISNKESEGCIVNCTGPQGSCSKPWMKGPRQKQSMFEEQNRDKFQFLTLLMGAHKGWWIHSFCL